MRITDFISTLNKKIGIAMPDEWLNSTDEIIIAQSFLEKINEYFFQTYDNIGMTTLNEKEYQYFSDFHKYWEEHHAEIINAKIDQQQARIVARSLHDATINFGEKIFDVTLNTHGINKQAIAQVRFFTANQDFREPPEDQFSKFLEDNTQFDAKAIYEDPVGFLNFMGNTRLSQSDKRVDFATHAAKFLIEKNITAYEIANYFENDAQKIRSGILATIGMGYGRKKTDMFIRDMVVLGVWQNLLHFDVIDVASDRNTMKLALRSRILRTEIPLLSSFLDIFGYQYSYIDEMSASAWRAVWEEWKIIEPVTAPNAPCIMDFLLYRIGREYCDDKLVEFVCENGHRFFHFGAQLKRCRICRAYLTPLQRLIPCQVQVNQLPRDEDGIIRLDESNLFRIFNGKCIFELACRSKNADFKRLSPPKAISIIGRTGWTDSYANRGEGGGGMMG
jgi:hypothetical protein